MILSGTTDTAATAGTDQSRSTKDQNKLAKDLNHFLTLLTTQLQHQDPLEPMDATEFTAQLVQFASVEQQIYQNTNLEKLINLQSASQLGNIVNYVGLAAEVEGQELPLQNGAAEFSYTLADKADKVTVLITDGSGKTVFTAQGETDAGVHRISWDGKDMDGIAVPDGTYNVTAAALDYNGDPLDVVHTVVGRVTGVAVGENGTPTLFMGDVDVAMEKVIAVKEPPAAVVQ
ncbi:MAG: flagellar hook assembly protein FlgD [Rhodospirillales bacterium]|nr:flagellar hook assembly protein FlgD [Rhodospirillales bacterium]MCW8862053.1 flagellar hook assembly protein FlgD [Rhodospirillales bacterium]